ncbi:TPA: 2-amino-4-hydroxy-6-hydroxymethyldihydropteridine diphosphokinase [Candidatus Gracilibacteria bacterium]|nr:2-amino-4-hydroxy-6-hydroxymethyldihydropteridine diphosphokinase [Candidatus Peregrinibacteria bacterium]HIQ56733.1 2-amino-4-hydroxy-6-hydroxymethyldihydropteridine diphosphokinase [Candidatus Gracilibacteria bacterium]HIQ57211.1 2-amino-4-hydroxy-6-hydroxymethyldihydropteridine diphosphokinase [Candidatus Gracilibacteria bacterium]
MKKNITIYLGLGSSLGDKEKIINNAIAEIKKWGENFLVSSFLYSEPWGGVAQNKFLNAVCSFEILENSEMTPEKLLQKIQKLEEKFQRTRSVKWEDRTLDVDILLYGEEKIETLNLIVPHVYILERDFVYEPLLEICKINRSLGDLKKYIFKIRSS